MDALERMQNACPSAVSSSIQWQSLEKAGQRAPLPGWCASSHCFLSKICGYSQGPHAAFSCTGDYQSIPFYFLPGFGRASLLLVVGGFGGGCFWWISACLHRLLLKCKKLQERNGVEGTWVPTHQFLYSPLKSLHLIEHSPFS